MHWHVSAVYWATDLVFPCYIYWHEEPAITQVGVLESVRKDSFHHDYTWMVIACENLDCLVEEMAI